MKGRCPGSKAMVFAGNGMKSVQVPNVNIGDCDYTIAFWIRLLHPAAGSKFFGSSKSGKLLYLEIDGTFLTVICHEVSAATQIHITCLIGSSGVVGNNWTHIAVTCEQDNGVKVFFNGVIENITRPLNISYLSLVSFVETLPPEETFFISITSRSTAIMDLHILGFALPQDEIYDLYRG